MDAQLKKGVLQMCVLKYISNQESYGYEIMKDITRLFPDVAEASVYAILRRLHAAGYLDVYNQEMPNVPTRKYYRISNEGTLHLDKSIEQWKTILGAIKEVGII